MNIEHSPELYSQIPCTQDSNEVAWDWQDNNTKSTSKDGSNKNNLLETPKRPKFLQKKRNMHSPLLQQGKWKQLKKENTQGSIEELAVELRALGERIIKMKQDEEVQTIKREDVNNSDPETQLVVEIELQKDEEMLEVALNNNRVDKHTVSENTITKQNSSLDDLFDDSINESLVKCTQEIEEKLNLETNRRDILNEEKQNIVSSYSSTGSSKNSNPARDPFTINLSNCLKTYSKNVTASGHNVEHSKSNTVGQKSELFEIPDDSFDDYLAACIDDNISTTEYNMLFNTKGTSSCSIDKKQINSNPERLDNAKCNMFDELKSKSNNYSTNYNKSTRGVAAQEASNSNVMANRKFFKTKSLSDQSFSNTSKGRGASKNVRSNVSIVNSSVAAASSIVKGHNHNPDHENRLFNGVGNTSTPNRSVGKDGSYRFVKYKSTSSLCNDKEHTKDAPLVRCTPEEIERKRLEAKMRLEAKRKLKNSTSQPEMSVKRPVKR